MKSKATTSKSDLTKILRQHFEDDKRSFTEIKDNQKKYEELLLINGNHFSSFAKSMAELKVCLEKHTCSFEEHVRRTEPMLSAYEKDTAFTRSLGEKTKKWSVRLGVTAATISALYVIKEAVIKLLILK